MSDITDSMIGTVGGLLALGIVANVASKTIGGLGTAKSKGWDWMSSKSSSSKSKGGKSIW